MDKTQVVNMKFSQLHINISNVNYYKYK